MRGREVRMRGSEKLQRKLVLKKTNKQFPRNRALFHLVLRIVIFFWGG